MTSWTALDDLSAKYRDETDAVTALLAAQPLSTQQRAAVRAEAEDLVRAARKSARRQGVVEGFLQEFSLGTREGLALMCLAEALLRTPDQDTRDRLIAEKIGNADWASHLGQSDSLFVNASTWGLMLTGKLVEVDDEARNDLPGFLKRLAERIGEPVVRKAVAQAIGIMGEQFVLGRSIEAALKRAGKEGQICSFDMLGEGARTASDAARYEQAYADALEAVGKASKGAGPEAGHGVSVKLSALSPRYEATHEDRVWSELYPRTKRLALIAARHDMNFTIDAEEADRLTLSLKLLDRLAREPELGEWQGLGLAVQAYQKRARLAVERVAEIARSSGRRLMVRLVKGAYWDSEIKRAQVGGRPDYPVFTTKAATDLSYLVCARALIAAAPNLYAQFATHNAHTLAAVHAMASEAGVKIEFQRLHGMGEALYQAADDLHGGGVVRTYAPVGGHEDLLPYLVRRLLENGANTSFVHALLDERVPAQDVVVDPIAAVEKAGIGPHPKIPRPVDIYGAERKNSLGVDLSIPEEAARLTAAARALEPLSSGPLIGGNLRAGAESQPMRSPSASALVVGKASEASALDIDAAFAAARAAQPAWDRLGGFRRAEILRAMGDTLEANRDRLVAICAREAGKTLADGVAEVREAADFCRYYAHLALTRFGGPETLKGPVGETNTLELHGRGVFVCISPWNFPLAIFTGQVAAALAAGNAVVAKPAEQTPLIASEAVKLFHAAGLPPGLLALTPGRGETVGAALTAHPGCDGVAFTGGTDTARRINQSLAGREGPIVPFIAETGGLNGMFVDTTALKEQVVDDVIASAFGSAGQRCSALRILFLPTDTADMLIDGIKGAMDALVLGDPADAVTDIGPVIDAEAHGTLCAHLERLEREAKVLHQLKAPEGGTFFGPVLAEIPSANFLEREVFGPVLHVVRYRPADLARVAGELAASRYGLTLGVHSRIDAFAIQVRELVPAGNVYVNRSIIGAVVGVQPFGGEGLSGTGPKAGGPNSLTRYAIERAVSVNITAQGGDPALLNLSL
ncbi:bifunctional proline dehydrogenase/L-glutamate gamma-semialdehyde dehydrogenase PutA [Phenylobacterium sp. LH3H17]|uniref:bifunctional proline dehydrogenase/L-glutamate gamma-semialdehyde dehydrogenase PutA n=1 Tax=Phenylobacterium sp. LH3H17 TaxID=2903901 RepID=UPI0020C9DE15|nr:bifunctional proline dehydrogenase/L-glutamate gamma-semialdehyde dehydrogenase PutA [Phenylobacterium sp. LH3H17]UTP41203.1 bifunctional proline dehydrogenase/L-glutamate gamma-semialdehyde dehydrogenase PutA [Phenylobacterium sp. LH3H17]